jgi:glyoxylase-like metal-dependent hydrolase (beta-lactamase superfamily II)
LAILASSGRPGGDLLPDLLIFLFNLSPLPLFPRPCLALFAFALAALAGCGGGPTRTFPQGAAITLAHADRWAHADANVGVYTSSNWGFSTNTFWIEGPDGVVVVDTQFLPSAAEEMIDWVERATGKKIVLAVVLHPNPDKYDGTATLQAHGVKVVTSEQVKKLVPGVHEKRLKSFYARYAPDFPKDAPVIDSFGPTATDLTAAGLLLHAYVMGPGCSDAHVVLEWRGHLFTGDLVAAQSHSWLELGHTEEWIQRLGEMRAMHPLYVHPGRGPSGGPELIDGEEVYLRRVEAIVADAKPTLPVRPEAIAKVKRAVVAEFPSYDYDVFLDIGLPAEWERQARLQHGP